MFPRALTDQEIDRAQQIAVPGVIRLVPFHPNVDVRNSQTQEVSYLLAAQHDSAFLSRFSSVASFAARAINTILRVLRDATTNQDTLHILSEDERYSREVGISITDGSGTTVYVRTDRSGVVSLDRSMQIDWKSAHVLIDMIHPAQ